MIPIRIERQTGPAPAADLWRTRPAGEIDWPRWTRTLERKRRGVVAPADWPGWVYRDLTRSSFRLEGIDVGANDVEDARAVPCTLRTRPARRLRAHLAILRSLDRDRPPHRQSHRQLSADQVMQWYTAVSSGLSTASLAAAGGERLGEAVRQINSPQRRLQPALIEIARLHAELLADPLFPGFNGILARLLLHAHLAQSGLPPVVFEAETDAWETPTTDQVVATLLVRMETTLDRLMTGRTGVNGPS